MTGRTAEPQNLLLKYPALEAAERDVLVAWLRALDARTLVSLLSDSRTEQKLLAIRRREPELQQGDKDLLIWLVAVMTFLGLAAALSG